VPDRQVRFTDQFFDRLDELLPDERREDGTPSVTDFLLFELPAIGDDLADDFEHWTLPTDDPDVRVYIGKGVLVRAYAIYAIYVGEIIEGPQREPARDRRWRSTPNSTQPMPMWGSIRRSSGR
jgi:hypothetical protein